MLLHLSLFVKLQVTLITGELWSRLGHNLILLIHSEGVGGGLDSFAVRDGQVGSLLVS